MILDILFVIILLWGLVTGYRKGIIYSVFSLFAFVFGTVAALKFGHVMAVYLEQWFNIGTKYLPFVSFIFMFLLVVLGFILAAKLLEGILKLVQMNFINKATGAFVWGFIGIFLLSTLFWYLNKYDIITESAKSGSVTYETIAPVSPVVTEKISILLPVVNDLYDSIELMINDLSEEHLPAKPFDYGAAD